MDTLKYITSSFKNKLMLITPFSIINIDYFKFILKNKISYYYK